MKIDEASALLASDQKERALVSAQMADHFARLAYDDELQLRASEVLAKALLQNERLLEAATSQDAVEERRVLRRPSNTCKS